MAEAKSDLIGALAVSIDEDRSDGDFSARRGDARLDERLAHERIVERALIGHAISLRRA